MTSFQLELNPLWLVLFALVAGGFSFFLYWKFKASWPTWFNKVFSVFRFSVVFLVLFILLEPFLKSTINVFDKPHVNVLIDNSSSVGDSYSKETRSVSSKLFSISDELKEQFDFDFFTFSGSLEKTDTMLFNEGFTNIQGELKEIERSTSGLNTVATVLVSDGIVNQGIFLESISSSTDVYTVGIGDTTERKDVQVKELFVNKSSFLGNEFPVQASVLAKGYKGKSVKARLYVNDKKVSEKEIKFSSNESIEEVLFNYTSKKKGFLRVAVKVDELKGEVTGGNNIKSRFVKINESKQKVAFVARNPHPDVKAIVASINKLEKYEVTVFNLSFGKKLPVINDYDVFILHQLPCLKCGNAKLVQEILKSNKSRWVISGINTRLRDFNSLVSSIDITRSRGLDEAGAIENAKFDLFELGSLDLKWLKYSPPLKVPYGNYNLAPESQVIFNQKIGTVTSEKPMLVYKETNNVKELVMLGEGIWNWKMTESLEKTNTDNFDKLISKLLGLLDQSRKENQFEATVMSDQFNTSQAPKFSFVSKNQLGELIYDNEINLKMFSGNKLKGEYNFKVSESNNFYTTPQLDSGVYNFIATSKIGGKTFKDVGVFSVEDVQLESKNLQADYEGLRVLASVNGGEFYEMSELGKISQDLLSKKYKNKITSNDEQKSLLDYFWLLLLVLLLVCAEWVARKAFGEV